jgi:single-strand DNA-binding protein
MSTFIDNRVQLLGFLGKDVDLRELAQGNKLARLSLATSEFKRNPEGQPEKITTWHNLIAWGDTADQMNDILKKGQKVFVEGKIVYRQYETTAGEKRNSTEIVVNAFKKLDKNETVDLSGSAIA